MNFVLLDDDAAMLRAIELAQLAKRQGDRPFGCVIYDDLGQLVSEAWGSERLTDPTHHSEILAIRDACRVRGGLLQGCTVVSTHEPCTLCVGGILHAKLSRVVYGSSRMDLPRLFRAKRYTSTRLFQDTTYPPLVLTGVRRKECIALFEDEQ